MTRVSTHACPPRRGLSLLARMRPLAAPAALLAALAAAPVAAQQTTVPFGSQSDSSAPIQVESESLSVSQDNGAAIFDGNVLIEQDNMRLSAARVEVIYDEAQSKIASLAASGGVTLVSGDDAAEAERADYDVTSGALVLSGDVLLVRGPSTIAAERMRVDVDAGTAQLEGRVRTFLSQDGN
ncbi:LptA/OstA family protein [Pseudooceanicola sp. 200-1SW]|uniref:LptA/OstA family protein n=1 Tax=Pseudooceanicola sp. 200-1SW TaxID=3425949 RepID=UPI003D7F9CFE